MSLAEGTSSLSTRSRFEAERRDLLQTACEQFHLMETSSPRGKDWLPPEQIGMIGALEKAGSFDYRRDLARALKRGNPSGFEIAKRAVESVLPAVLSAEVPKNLVAHPLFKPLVRLGATIMEEAGKTEDDELLLVALDTQFSYDLACTPKYQEYAEYLLREQAEEMFFILRKGLFELFCEFVRLS